MRGRALLFAVAMIAGVAGCEAIVSSAVPAFKCEDSDPASCPVGQVCATATGTCISMAKSCVVTPCTGGLTCDQGTLQCVSSSMADGSADAPGNKTDASADANGNDVSSPTDSGGPPYATGAKCSLPADCQSGLCGDSSIFGSSYFSKVGAVCTVPCCTSEDCNDPSLVCIGPGTGGHYCVPAAPLGRSLGAKGGGIACTFANECRSGVCVSGVCADSCCADTNCNGNKCKPVNVEQVDAGILSQETYACSKSGGSATDAMCPGSFDTCASGVCAGSGVTFCFPPCCGTASVSGSGNNVCIAADVQNGDYFNFSSVGTTGTGVFGTACSNNNKCVDYFCDKAQGAATGTCSSICCTDADCARPTVCRPKTDDPTTHQLRCAMP